MEVSIGAAPAAGAAWARDADDRGLDPVLVVLVMANVFCVGVGFGNKNGRPSGPAGVDLEAAKLDGTAAVDEAGIPPEWLGIGGGGGGIDATAA